MTIPKHGHNKIVTHRNLIIRKKNLPFTIFDSNLIQNFTKTNCIFQFNKFGTKISFKKFTFQIHSNIFSIFRFLVWNSHKHYENFLVFSWNFYSKVFKNSQLTRFAYWVFNVFFNNFTLFKLQKICFGDSQKKSLNVLRNFNFLRHWIDNFYNSTECRN